jgi:hypothetical protein
MAKDDSTFNIFDPTSHKKKKKEATSIPPDIETRYKDLNVDEMLERIKTMQKDLENKLEETFEKGKISTTRVKEVISGLEEPSLDYLRKEKKKFENEVFSALGEGARKEHLEKEQQKEDKVRKGKTLGSRRKWMPMK